MARGRNVLVWLFSITLWLLAQWASEVRLTTRHGLTLDFLTSWPWQLLFVAGAYFGYRKATGQPSPVPASRLLFTFCLVVVIVLFTLRHQGVLLGRTSSLFNTEIMLQEWRSINHPFRLINFAAYAYILWYLPRSVDQRFHQLSAVSLPPLPRQTFLQVFVWSISCLTSPSVSNSRGIGCRRCGRYFSSWDRHSALSCPPGCTNTGRGGQRCATRSPGSALRLLLNSRIPCSIEAGAKFGPSLPF